MNYIYKVYVLPDAENRIIDINSDAFLFDFTGWVKIDEGTGDRFHHAQNHYLPKPKMDERGIYQYKLVNKTEVVERTVEEMNADYIVPAPSEPTTDEILNALLGVN